MLSPKLALWSKYENYTKISFLSNKNITEAIIVYE